MAYGSFAGLDGYVGGFQPSKEGTDALGGMAAKKYETGAALAAYLKYAQQQDANEGEILKQSLLYSSGAMAATALGGQTLESIRRALKGKVPVEEPLEEQSSLPAV